MVTKILESEYRNTDAGVIPKDWNIKKIKEFTDATSGGTPSTFIPEYWNGNIRWMSSGELNLKKIYDVEGRITDLGLRNSSTKLIPIKCVLIGLAGQGKTRGTVAINYVELCVNQSIGAIYPNNSFIPEYLYYNLDFRYGELRNLSTGASGRGGLNLTLIRNLFIPLPSTKEEQTRISQVLSETDELIQYLDKLISKKKDIKKGAMQDLLEGKKRLPGFSGVWEEKYLGEVADFVHGHGLSKSDLDESGQRKCIHYGQLFTEYKESINEIKFNTNVDTNLVYSKENDVLMPTSDVTPRGLATASCIKERGVALGGGILIIRLHKGYEGLFLSYFITQNKKKILKLTKGSTVFHIYANDLSNLEMLFPKYEEQQAITNILLEMDKELEELKKKRDKYKMIKEGMMQQLLTGRIRLKWKN